MCACLENINGYLVFGKQVLNAGIQDCRYTKKTLHTYNPI